MDGYRTIDAGRPAEPMHRIGETGLFRTYSVKDVLTEMSSVRKEIRMGGVEDNRDVRCCVWCMVSCRGIAGNPL